MNGAGEDRYSLPPGGKAAALNKLQQLLTALPADTVSSLASRVSPEIMDALPTVQAGYLPQEAPHPADKPRPARPPLPITKEFYPGEGERDLASRLAIAERRRARMAPQRAERRQKQYEEEHVVEKYQGKLDSILALPPPDRSIIEKLIGTGSEAIPSLSRSRSVYALSEDVGSEVRGLAAKMNAVLAREYNREASKQGWPQVQALYSTWWWLPDRGTPEGDYFWSLHDDYMKTPRGQRIIQLADLQDLMQKISNKAAWKGMAGLVPGTSGVENLTDLTKTAGKGIGKAATATVRGATQGGQELYRAAQETNDALNSVSRMLSVIGGASAVESSRFWGEGAREAASVAKDAISSIYKALTDKNAR